MLLLFKHEDLSVKKLKYNKDEITIYSYLYNFMPYEKGK